MIVREWRGHAARQRADAYPEHFRRNVLPELQSVNGFLGADLVRRDVNEEIEYVVLSRWSSMDAIHSFAGDDPDRAVIEPGAVAALSDYDRRVRHYEVLETLVLS